MKETPEQRLAHAKYEYNMAMHCIAELHKPQSPFQWNVLFAAFAVYFRNSKDFLTGDDDQNSIKAQKYVKRFDPNSAEDLEDEIKQLHAEVLHLGGKRISEDEKKFGLVGANTLMKWLTENIEKFVTELEGPLKTAWLDNFGFRDDTTVAMRGWTGPVQPPSSAVRVPTGPGPGGLEQRTSSSYGTPMQTIHFPAKPESDNK
jgi:hypothetical protein